MSRRRPTTVVRLAAAVAAAASLLTLSAALAPCLRNADCATTTSASHVPFCLPSRVCLSFHASALALLPQHHDATQLLPQLELSSRNDGGLSSRRLSPQLKAIFAAANSNPIPIPVRLVLLNLTAGYMRDVHPFRNLQLNVYGVDPVPHFLKLAELHLPGSKQVPSSVEFELHMMSIFRMMNDLHTRYRPTTAMRRAFATLGFSAAVVYPGHHLLVADVVEQFQLPSTFQRGVKLISVDGVAARRLARRLGAKGYAANAAARLTRGTIALSFRSFELDPVPLPPTTRIVYETLDGKREAFNAGWAYVAPDLGDASAAGPAIRTLVPPHPEEVLATAHRSTEAPPAADEPTPTTRQDGANAPLPPGGVREVPTGDLADGVFSAAVIGTTRGDLGYLNMISFRPLATPELVAELTRVFRLFPPAGLIIDVRNNPGGSPDLAKALTQLFSDAHVPPLPLSMRMTPAAEQIAAFALRAQSPALRAGGEAFAEPIRQAKLLGDEFTSCTGDVFAIVRGNVPLPPVPRAYFGPVVTLTSALTYSSADFFAATQVDAGTSLLVGVDATTGAGGASVLRLDDLLAAFPGLFGGYTPTFSLTLSHVRIVRGGKNSGTLVEHFGVKPDVRYYRTRRDVLEEDADLREWVAKKLDDIRKADS